MSVQEIKTIFLTVVLLVLAALIIISFIRAIRGPLIADRIVQINVIGSITIVMLAILTVLLGESWLTDVALVYAMLSFISVVVVTKIYIGVYREKHGK